MFEDIILKKKSWVSKVFFISLSQIMSGWETVDGVIASRYFHQKKVSLPVGLSRRETAEYIKLQQAKLMQLDSSNYCLRSIPIYNDEEKKADALWCMALKKQYIQETIHHLHQKKKLVCQLVCDWQYAFDQILRHHLVSVKNRYCICCYTVHNITVFIACIQDKVIHMDMLQKKWDAHWINQQVDIFKTRSQKHMHIDYVCSADIFEVLTQEHEHGEKWKIISMDQT